MADVDVSLVTVQGIVYAIPRHIVTADDPALRVNGLIQYRAGGKLKPGIVTAVSGSQVIDLRIGHAGGSASSVTKWKRSTPATAGWVR